MFGVHANLERCKGHTQKGHREKVQDFRIFQGVFRVFSGCFRGVSCGFRVFSGCFRGVFPMPFPNTSFGPVHKAGDKKCFHHLTPYLLIFLGFSVRGIGFRQTAGRAQGDFLPFKGRG